MNGSAIFAKQEFFSYEKTAGDLLREARELKGLSQQSVASSLNLMTSHVVTLEADRYNPDLEGKHFAEYIKSYAGLVDLNPDILLALYEIRNHSPLNVLPQPSIASAYEKAEKTAKVASQGRGPRRSSGFVSRSIAILSLLFLAWFINRSHLEPRDLLLATGQSMQTMGVSIQTYVQERFPFVEAEQPVDLFEQNSALTTAVQKPSDTSREVYVREALVRENPSTAVREPSTFGRESSERQESELSGSQGLELADSETVLAQALAAPDALGFIFSSDCWVEVYDQTGKQIFMGNKLTGSQLNLSGNGPFEVLVGNSRGVSLRFNGDAVPIKVHEYSDHTRFVVGPAGVHVTTQEVFSAAFENFKAEQLRREASGVKVSISEENFQGYRLDVVGGTVEDDVLMFQFSSNCWVEVYDSQQRPLVMATKLAGQTLQVTGDAPFEVRVGNSKAVELTLNGQSVNIKQHPEIDSTELVVGQR